MTVRSNEPQISISLTELEDLIRRVVQETMHNELMHLLRKPDRAILEYWEHEGPEDAAGDEKLLADALATIQAYEANRTSWKSLAEFEAELAKAENAHELSS